MVVITVLAAIKRKETSPVRQGSPPQKPKEKKERREKRDPTKPLTPEEKLAEAAAQRTPSKLAPRNRDGPSKPGSQPFLLACAQGHVELVRALYSKGAEIERAGDDGFTPFMAACALGHVDVARFLLTLEVDVERTDHLGRSPFMAACGRGHLPVIKLLARDAGVDIDRRNVHGGTPLMFAAAHGHLPVVKFLHALGGKLEQCDDHGYTALMLACHRGRRDVVQFLAAHGALRVNPRCDAYALLRAQGHAQLLAWLEATHDWRTPLHYAPFLGADRTLKLLRSGLDIDARCEATPVARPAAPSSDGSASAAGGSQAGDESDETDDDSIGDLMANIDAIDAAAQAAVKAEADKSDEAAAAARDAERSTALVALDGVGSDISEEESVEMTIALGPSPLEVAREHLAAIDAHLAYMTTMAAREAARASADGACKMRVGEEEEELDAEGIGPVYGLHRHGRKACELVIHAAQPWSRSNHYLFPRATRARVADLRVIARQLANSRRSNGDALWEAFTSHILPHAISRYDR